MSTLHKSCLSRKSFIELAASTSIAAAVYDGVSPSCLAFADSEVNKAQETVEVIRTMCRGCGKMECCVWVTVSNGRAIKIEGDESNFGSSGNCCTKSQASLQACYHPDRLRYPLKRSNAKDNNDPGWVRVSWEEALSDCAKKFSEIREQRGVNAQFNMVGTSRIWCMNYLATNGLLNTVNNYAAYQVCKGPRHVATSLQSANAFSYMATSERPRVLVRWGGASELSNYDDSTRTTVDAAMKADYHIVVDPRLTNLGKEADLWLPLRPGTDAAMALGWLNVIVNKGLYNEIWAKRWTNLPFLVAEKMPATPGTPKKTALQKPIMTKLLKESDLVEGGSQNKFMVWDNISNSMTWFDSESGYWANEKPLNIASTRQLPGKEASSLNLAPGTTQGYVIDMSDFSRCDPIIDPALEGTFEVTLKDGTKTPVRPAWEYFVEHLNHYNPETVAEICGVPSEDIIKAATIYATPIDQSTGYGNGGIQYMLAIEHSSNAIQTARALDALVGLTNNFDTPGGNRGPTHGPFESGQWNLMREYMAYRDKDATKSFLGSNDIPMMPEMRWGDATAIWDGCNRGERALYPLYGGICQSGDVLSQSNALYGFEGLKKLDFFVVLDLWHTPTSQVSDYLLPVRHWLEVDCPRTSQGSAGMEGSHCKCVEPLAETRFDPDIIMDLGKYMGYEFNPQGKTDEQKWPSSAALLDQYAEAYLPLTKEYPGNSPWEKWKSYFQEQGMQEMKALQPDSWGTYRRYESGVSGGSGQSLEKGVPAKFGAPGFDTPTRKQEIYNTKIETYHSVENPLYGQDIEGFSRVDELDGEYLTSTIGPFTLPTYTEPPESPIANAERAKEYPYIMATGRRIPVYFHSEHRQLPWCRELWPVPRIEINPKDAEELGIDQGDWVWIETERNRIRQVADLYYGIRPGTVNCEHQWWLPEFKGLTKGFDLVNVNTLVNKDLRDPLSGSTYARAYNVKIYKATAENSPFGNPVPCDIDGTEMITSCEDTRLQDWQPVYDNDESAKSYAERNGVRL